MSYKSYYAPGGAQRQFRNELLFLYMPVMQTLTPRSNCCLKVTELSQKPGVLYGFYHTSVVFMVFYARAVYVKIVCRVETERNFLTFIPDN